MTDTRDTVVLLHGIFKNPLGDMRLAENFFRKSGYNAHRIEYELSTGGIKDIAAYVWKEVRALGGDRSAKLHFVAHSMGGVVTDSLIRQFDPKNLGRVVMWSSPLQGCEHADALNDFMLTGPLYRYLGGQPGQDLQIRTLDPSRDQPITYDLGMLAGSVSINPFGWYFLKNAGIHDGVVPVARTKRDGIKAENHRILPIPHPWFLISPGVHRLSRNFIQSGRFDGPA